jgi:hypothetical protein
MLDASTVEVLSDVSEDSTTLTFSSSTPLLDSVENGDIIVLGVSDITPHGLLRKVVSKSAGGG